MRRLLRSTAIALALGFFLPAPGPETIFVYKTANAAPTLGGDNGLPNWIQGSCCGPQDAHKLRVDQVHRVSDDYYRVDGYLHPIPAQQAQSSQDGDFWIFYRDDGEGIQSGVYCFFVPMAF